MTKNYVYGNISHEESTAKWKSTPEDLPLTDKELSHTFEDMSLELSSYLRKNSLPENGLYFREDSYTGDRTQYLEVVDPQCFSIYLLNFLTELLKKHTKWRIAVITYIEDGPVIVYRDAVRLSSNLESLDLDDSVQVIIDKLNLRGHLLDN